jgi:hypothetical protein
MNGWNILNNILSATPMAVAVIISSGAAVVFIIGFARHGTNFVKSGFKQAEAGSSFEERFNKRFDMLNDSFDKRFNALSDSFDKRFNDLSDSFDKRFNALSDSFETRFDTLKADIDALDIKLSARIDTVETRLGARIDNIENNHFGHLKSYLGILNGVLLDQKIINNETKARLDSELNGM